MLEGENDNGELAALVDKDRIRELLARLASSVDRVHEEGIRCCYSDDGYDDHGAFQGSGAAFATRPERRLPNNLASTHILGQTMIDLRGDEAFCETYFFCAMVREVDGRPIETHVSGRYLDHVLRQGGSWVVRYRRVVMDWGRQQPSSEGSSLSGHRRGQRWPDDAVYHVEAWHPVDQRGR